MTATFVPRSAAWHADRQSTIGASDAPIITGDAPWGDLLSLYAQKAGIIDPPDIETSRTQWGLRLEAVVAEWFTETYGLRLRRDNTRPRHPDHPWMATSLDRRVIGEPALVEIKTARFPTDEWGPAETAEVPAHVLVQCQHELAVTGAETCYVAVLFAGSDPRRYVIPRDNALIEALVELEAEFMDCVRNGTPPDNLIRRQHPVVPLREGEIIADETGPLARGIEGVYLLRQEIKERKADLATAEEAVKTLMAGVTAARAGAFRATYRQNADSNPVRWDLVAAGLRKALETVNAAHPQLVADLLGHELDCDALVSLFTDTKRGNRPLLITKKEEAEAA